MKKRVIAVFAMATLIASGAIAAHGQERSADSVRIKTAERALEITNLRSSLAKTLIKTDSAVTEETFKSVCGAVAKRAKEINEKEGLRIRHASAKNRNPANGPTQAELELIGKFQADAGLKELGGETLIDGKRFFRYTMPIYVEEACLSCHGAKEKRPPFIAAKYPDDKAFDFKVGDLRGIISVLAPID